MTRPPVTTAVDAVAADLEARILAGELPPGSRLRESALTEHYDVARHTVRAALRALGSARLVVVEAHRGARVAELDAQALRDLFALRAALEVEAARLLAARGALDPPPDAVLVAAAALDVACAAQDRAAVDAAHAGLHHAIVAAAGSARITDAHAGLTAESRVALLQSRDVLGLDHLAHDHRALLAALARRGPEALREHLRHGEDAASPRPGTA